MARLAIVLVLLLGAALTAQGTTKPPAPPKAPDGKPGATLPPEMDLAFIAPDDVEVFFESWQELTPEGKPGPFVIALPYAIQLKYREPADEKQPGKKLELLADQALVWFVPEKPEDAKNDPMGALASGVAHVQFYGEGNVLLRYEVGGESFVIRADRVFLDFEKGRVSSYNLTGKMDNVRAHSGAAAEGETSEEGPVRTGAGIGDASEKAKSAPEDLGAPPGQSDAPLPAGKARKLPQEMGQRLFMRAKTLRLISLTDERKEVELEDGSVSSSSLAVASYSLASSRLRIIVRKDRSTIYTTRPSMRILDWPLLTLPFDEYRYDLDSVFPIRQFDIFQNSRFGLSLRTYIDAVAAYDFFADPEPPFHPLSLGPQIDYYSKRGWGGGINLDWGGIHPFDDHGRASLRTYRIVDRGDDRDRARDLGWYPLENEERGRAQAWLTKNFGGGWQLDSIFGYYSDRNFRQEFYERDFYSNLPTDSFIRITKRYADMNAYLFIAPRINDFENKTEYLPNLGFDVQRTSVGDFGLKFSSHTDIAMLRWRPPKDAPGEIITAPRADSSNWFNLPLDLRYVNLDPFVGTRVTVAQQYLEIPRGPRPGLSADGTFPGMRAGDVRKSGLLYRIMPFFGVNLSTMFTGTFPGVRAPGLGISGLRHVIMPYVRYTNVVFNSLDEIPERAFVPFDSVDVLDEFHEVRLGLRNRFQTRQGWGAERKTVDYLDLMVEVPIYPNPRRDNFNRVFGPIEIAGVWRPAPDFSISGQGFYDPYIGSFTRASASFNVDFTDILRGSLYYRLLRDVHQVVGVNVQLTLSEVYGVKLLQEYDLEQGKFRDTRIELTRDILEAFTLGFVFVRDAAQGDIGFYFSISASFAGPSGSRLLR